MTTDNLFRNDDPSLSRSCSTLLPNRSTTANKTLGEHFHTRVQALHDKLLLELNIPF